MRQLILKVQDKTKVPRLQEFCQVLYVSKYMNTVGVEISEADLDKLNHDENILDYRESAEGKYLTV